MSFVENIRLAFGSLKANKMRSFLTMLGIIIGITSVIAIMTVGSGMTKELNRSMSTFGASNVTLYLSEKSSGQEFNVGSAVIEQSDLMTPEMIDQLKTKFSSEIETISLSSTVGAGQVSIDRDDAKVTIMGINGGYLEAQNAEVVAGREFLDRDENGAKRVALVTDKFVEQVFDGNNQDALGTEISVNTGTDIYDLTIIGVYKYEATTMGFGGNSEENTMTDLYIPYSTALELTNQDDGYSNVVVKIKAGVDGLVFADNAKEYMKQFYTENPDYEVDVFSMESMIKEINSMLEKVSLALSIIAGISLLVGGIGVMNIMLVSVSERTKEIGTRKALGATNANIRVQFVIESIIVCLIGGVIGILLGGTLGYVASLKLGAASLPTVGSILLAFGFSLAIGVFFGYYPANRAAKLNPIEALRYE